MNEEPQQSKLRGGYYTPQLLARHIAEWAIQTGAERVLEPSCGDGELLAAAASLLGPQGHLTGVELFGEEADKAQSRAGKSATVITQDAFRWYAEQQPAEDFDAVIGNPPFIRYQNFPASYRQGALDLMQAEGLVPNRLMNAWVPFVVLATKALREGGRLGLVLPAELLQVTYASQLRHYLASNYNTIEVITFRHLVFTQALQEVVLVFAEKGSSPNCRIDLTELKDEGELNSIRINARRRTPAELDHAREKWIQYYLSDRELGLVRSLEDSPSLTTLGNLCEVDVGVVTGRNEFFVMDIEKATELSLATYCQRLVGRSAQIPGLLLDEDDWMRLYEQGQRCLLLQLGERNRSQLSRAAQRYIKWGESQNYQAGYKCRIRLPRWWNVPSTWIPDGFLLRQVYQGPRIVANEANATCTDTIHRVRVKPEVSIRKLSACSMNSLTFAFSELRGRSYGGGVLELEPTEAEGLPFPFPANAPALEDVDLWARRKSTEEVLAEADRLVLRAAGLTSSDIATLRGIWSKLSERRLRRGRGRR